MTDSERLLKTLDFEPMTDEASWERLKEHTTREMEQYLKYYDKICDYIKPEVVYFSEDLSGVNGPMISPDMFRDAIIRRLHRLLLRIIAIICAGSDTIWNRRVRIMRDFIELS